MVEVFAAGNDGDSGHGSVTPPGTAKNAISGAAVGEHPPDRRQRRLRGARLGRDDDIIDSRAAARPTIAAEARLVAPGTHVTEVSPQHPAHLTDGDVPQSPVPGGQHPLLAWPPALRRRRRRYRVPRHWYATGICASTAAARRPSPALTKAILVNSASDLVGGEDGKGGTMANVPNTDQGWGRCTWAGCSTRRCGHTTTRLLADLLGAMGESVTRAYQVADPAKPVKVTLPFTDAPARRRATRGGTTRTSWSTPVGGLQGQRLRGQPLAHRRQRGSARQRRERLPPAGTTGRISVKVVGTSVGGNVVPNVGDATDQDFALVASNASESSAPALSHESTPPNDSAGGMGTGTSSPARRSRSVTAAERGYRGATSINGPCPSRCPTSRSRSRARVSRTSQRLRPARLERFGARWAAERSAAPTSR